MTREVTIVAQHVGPVGGMERQLTEVITGLVDAGWRVRVIARACELPGVDVDIVRVRGPSRPAALGFPWFFVAAGLLVRLRGRGLIHTNGSIMWARADVATVHFCHKAYQALSDEPRGSKTTLPYRINSRISRLQNRLAETWCMRPGRVRALVGISRGVSREAERFYGIPRERIHTIPYGVDSERFRPDPSARAAYRGALGLSEECLVAVFVGGEWLRKGLSAAIEAVARTREWSLVVVGRGDIERFSRVAAAAGVASRVRFTGPDPAPERAYAAADAFVFPTRYETFSLVTHEAAAAGLPILAGRTSGIEDLIVPGENGWFVEQDPEAIAGHLEALCDPAWRRRLGNAAREAVAHLRWADAQAAHVRLYDALLNA